MIRQVIKVKIVHSLTVSAVTRRTSAVVIRWHISSLNLYTGSFFRVSSCCRLRRCSCCRGCWLSTRLRIPFLRGDWDREGAIDCVILVSCYQNNLVTHRASCVSNLSSFVVRSGKLGFGGSLSPAGSDLCAS